MLVGSRDDDAACSADCLGRRCVRRVTRTGRILRTVSCCAVLRSCSALTVGSFASAPVRRGASSRVSGFACRALSSITAVRFAEPVQGHANVLGMISRAAPPLLLNVGGSYVRRWLCSVARAVSRTPATTPVAGVRSGAPSCGGRDPGGCCAPPVERLTGGRCVQRPRGVSVFLGFVDQRLSSVSGPAKDGPGPQRQHAGSDGGAFPVAPLFASRGPGRRTLPLHNISRRRVF